jgi:hypothetical protein
MRIQLTTEGGVAYFPGLSQPLCVDTDELTETEAAELMRLLNAVRFFDLPPVVGPPHAGAADYRQYTLTAEDGGRSHTVRWSDPIQDPDVRALLAALRAKAVQKKR